MIYFGLPMKITPETRLSLWAVGTAWLLIYVVTQYGSQAGLDLTLMRAIQVGSAVVGLALFPAFRKWFRAWLLKTSGGGGN